MDLENVHHHGGGGSEQYVDVMEVSFHDKI